MNISENSKFVTLTFADNVKELGFANYEFKKFIQRLQDKIGLKIQYACVPEFQKRGAIHFHVIMFNLPYIKHKVLSDTWGQGFVKINRIDQVDNVGAYVCKYMQKAQDDDRLHDKKCYFTSRGLKKPVEIENQPAKNLADSLPADSKTYEVEFENDHLGKVSYKQYNLKSAKIEDVI